MARKKLLLTDEQWKKIEPFLPKPQPNPRGGRPRAPNHPVVEAILWVLWTGAPWMALPEKYPSPSTC